MSETKSWAGRRPTPDEMRAILEAHARWLRMEPGGERAVLSDSDLSGSDLRGSDLRDSDLSGSNLSGSDLRGSYLRDSDLTPIRDDLWAVLSAAPAEVPGLRAALAEGRVNGSTYTGTCACLVGTIANVRGCNVEAIEGLSPNASRPAERFFLAIDEGDTPETNQASRIALEWVDDWLTGMRAAFGPAVAQASSR